MINAFVTVWTSLTTYLTSLFPSIIELFWTEGTTAGSGSLTFVGVMAVISAGVALMLLIFNLVRSFFVMRG